MRFLPDLKSPLFLLLGFIAVSLSVVFLVFVAFEAALLIGILERYGYYLIAALALFTVVALAKSGFLRDILAFLRSRKGCCVAIFAIFMLVLTGRQEPVGMKVYSDEALLVATSLKMHKDRIVSVPFSAYEVGGVSNLFGRGYVDKRPTFFPFVVSLLHDVFGYRIANAYAVNVFSAFVFCVVSVRILCFLLPVQQAVGFIPLFFSLPVFIVSTFSAGFEVFNLAVLSLFILGGVRFVAGPSLPRWFAFVGLAVLLASVRYESILYSFLIPILFLMAWRRNSEALRHWVIFLTPILYFLPLCYLAHHFSNSAFWQMEVVHSDQPFGLKFIPGNLEHAVYFMFQANSKFGNSILVSFLGVISIVALFAFSVSRWRRFFVLPIRHRVIVACVGIVIVHFIILMAFHYGQADNLLVSRVFLPVFYLFSLAPFVYLGVQREVSRPEAWGGGGKALLWGSAAWFCLFTMPQIADGYSAVWRTISRDVELSLQCLGPLDRGKNLVLFPYGPVGVVYGFSSTSIYDVNKDPDFTYFLKDCGFLQDIYFVESLYLNPFTGEEKLAMEPDLDERFELETVYFHQWDHAMALRIEKVVGVRGYDKKTFMEESDADLSDPENAMIFFGNHLP